jgi:flagellin-like protein
MQLKKLLTDDEGVSPVIGVILMVAITVILAAVIAAFVLGIGDTDDPAPNANLEIDSPSSGDVRLEHTSGDSIVVGDTELGFGGAQAPLETASAAAGSGGIADVNSVLDSDGGSSLGASDEVSAGGEIFLETGSAGSEVTVQLIHSPSGDASNVYFDETVEVSS